MRRALMGTQIILNENEEFVGISLGSDFCAEHEWGITKLKHILGIPLELTKKNVGLKYRTITKNNKENIIFKKFTLVKDKKEVVYFALMVSSEWSIKHSMKTGELNSELMSAAHCMGDAGVGCAWDESSFGIVVPLEHKGKLTQLYKAFETFDISIGLFGGGAFENASLTVAIKSKIPKENIVNITNNDKGSVELSKVIKKLNLEEKARKKDKNFMVISLKWFDYNDKKNREKLKEKYKTKYDVQCWLNGTNDNYGWFTVEQIQKWIKSKKETVAEVI